MSDLMSPQALEGGFDPRSAVFNRLLKNRVIMLGSDVNDEIANQICAQLLYLEGEDPSQDIWLYINSPGGSVTAGMAIYDTMQFVGCDVATVCLGLAASMGQFLLTAGAAGKRYTLPNARIMMHQPLAGLRGQAADIAIQAEQLRYTKRRMAELIAYHSGQTARADPGRLRARPLVHRRGGQGVRPRRQGHPPPRRDHLTRHVHDCRPSCRQGRDGGVERCRRGTVAGVCGTIVNTGPMSTAQLAMQPARRSRPPTPPRSRSPPGPPAPMPGRRARPCWRFRRPPRAGSSRPRSASGARSPISR